MIRDDQPREFGHIYAREGTKFWWVRYWANGKQHRESSGSTDRRKAEKLLARREAEVGVPGAFVAPSTKRTTFEQLCEGIRTDYRLNGRRSADRLENSLTRLGRVFAGAKARAITADRLAKYAADRFTEGAARQTVRNELGALGHAFRLAKRAKLVAEVPDFPEIGDGPIRTGFFEWEDFTALLPELPEPLRAPITFAYHTSWRVPSEVLPLQWEQVDLRAGILRLEPGTTKNGEGRTFPFAKLLPLRDLLEQQRRVVSAMERRLGRIIPFVFPSETGGQIGDYHKVWRAACLRAAYEGEGAVRRLVRPALLDRIPHDLRRTAIRNFERAGVPRSVAMKLTGQKTESVYRRYAIVSEADLSDGVAKLAALFGAQLGAQSPLRQGSAR